jgi:hypothetical protein
MEAVVAEEEVAPQQILNKEEHQCMEEEEEVARVRVPEVPLAACRRSQGREEREVRQQGQVRLVFSQVVVVVVVRPPEALEPRAKFASLFSN